MSTQATPANYQVIARRWRPQQFHDIVGQEHIVRTLQNAITTQRIGHAYLFVGPRGTGKTTTARIFAKALNCTNGPKPTPPDDDPICQAIVNGTCMDVIEIDAATNRSIEDAKTIRDECQFAPAQCKYKIFIIDEIHQLSKDAFNALLKTLEEPPPHIKFIFATTEADKLLPTITSRCQRFEFQPIPEEKIAARLAHITTTEHITAAPQALHTIALLANGGMRDAQTILDQVISFCGKTITPEDIANIYGLPTPDDITTLAHAMATGDYPRIIATTDHLHQQGRDIHRTHQHLQAHIRDALLDAIRNHGQSNRLGGPPLQTEQILRMIETLQAGEHLVRYGLAQHTNFQVTLLKAVEQSKTHAIDTLIKELNHLANQLPQEPGQKKKLTPEPPPTPPPTPQPPTPEPTPEPAPPTENPPPPEAEATEADDPALPDPELTCDPTEQPMPPLTQPQTPATIADAGTPEFNAAIARTPQGIITMLHEIFHTTFTRLIPPPPPNRITRPLP
ncbi:MAG: DNA polymerase III subunit gamma/tau [Puniceicoccales bacterium]|jgi:DNA polymerase-3 subunit gamma/tau|nr:DNA polymerase III subunit gamma/tau [Puniceicoccales bacterium]